MELNALNRVLPVMATEARPSADLDIPRELITAVLALNRSEFFGSDRELSFQRDAEAHRVVIRIKDRKSGEVLEQIPPEQVLQVMADLQRDGQPE